MIQIYKSAYPKESVIIDPVAQMQQKVGLAKQGSGQAAPDDFTAITAAFGEAWASVIPATGKASSISALEYRERSLLVRLKPDGDAPTQKMKTALAKRDLSLDLVPSQSGGVVWQIRGSR
jgi:general secretion pathway protein L